MQQVSTSGGIDTIVVCSRSICQTARQRPVRVQVATMCKAALNICSAGPRLS